MSCSLPSETPTAVTAASTGTTPDTTAPSAPSGLTATAASSTQVNLAWTASTDDVGVFGYEIQRCQGPGCGDFADISTGSTTTFNDTAAAPSTAYSYRVRASDAAGNLSAWSNIAVTSTPATPVVRDTTPPSAPSNLVATPFSASRIDLSWTAATDDTAVAGYWVERCAGASCVNFAHLAPTPAAPLTFSDTGATASAGYTYRMRANDAAGNLSGYSNTAFAAPLAASGIAVTITPGRGGVTLTQTITLTANVANDVGAAGVTWGPLGSLSSVSTTSATFSSPVPGSFTVTATSVADGTKSATVTIGVTDLFGVFTQRNDAQRTGQNPQEYALNPASVNSSTFGKLFSCPVDDLMYAQPLYAANLSIAGGVHNTVFAATMNNSVYAFDADGPACTTLWTKSLLNGGTPVQPLDTDPGHPTGNDIPGNIGITGTPVIDPVSQTLYLVSKTKEGSVFHQRLHALSLADGHEKFGGPAEISDAITVGGTGDTGDVATCTSAPGNVPFCALHQNQRPALLLLNGFVYIAWAGHDDIQPFHGWVMGFKASDLTRAPVAFNSTPDGDATLADGGEGGIWQSGGGPAADAEGNIYVITGNGTFDTSGPAKSRRNLGDSFVKLGTANGLAAVDFFTPFDQDLLGARDLDLGSGGPMVLPDSAGSAAHPHVLVGGDKRGVLYVIDRDNMGGFNPDTAAQVDLVLQEIGIKDANGTSRGVFSTPAFWQGSVYLAASGDVVKRFAFQNAAISATPVVKAGDTFKFPGASPVVSSQGGTSGIVWALNTNANGTNHGAATGSAPAILFAYDAITLVKLYSSPNAAGPGAAGNAVKFVAPTVANGKVYIGTQTEVSVFGLLP